MNKIEIYTDGGCRCHVEKGGTIKPTDKSACAYLLQMGEHKKIDGKGYYGKTNNEMELTAVILALKQLNDSANKYQINVYSDSAYVVNGINNKWYVKWRNNGWTKDGGLKNAQLWQELVGLYESFDHITFHKVKGHSTNENNNLVDEYLNKIMDNMEDKSIDNERGKCNNE